MIRIVFSDEYYAEFVGAIVCFGPAFFPEAIELDAIAEFRIVGPIVVNAATKVHQMHTALATWFAERFDAWPDATRSTFAARTRSNLGAYRFRDRE